MISDKKYKIIVIGLLALSIASITYGIILTKKYSSKSAEQDSYTYLMQANESLVNSNDSLHKEYESEVKRYNDLMKEIDLSEVRYNLINSKYLNLKDSIKYLNADESINFLTEELKCTN
jgi:hypothetical protein